MRSVAVVSRVSFPRRISVGVRGTRGVRVLMLRRRAISASRAWDFASIELIKRRFLRGSSVPESAAGASFSASEVSEAAASPAGVSPDTAAAGSPPSAAARSAASRSSFSFWDTLYRSAISSGLRNVEIPVIPWLFAISRSSASVRSLPLLIESETFRNHTVLVLGEIKGNVCLQMQTREHTDYQNTPRRSRGSFICMDWNKLMYQSS